MKTAYRTLSICGILAISGIAATTASATLPSAQQGFGAATAYVVHINTGEGLPNMPVSAMRIVTPGSERPGKTQVFFTEADGSAFLSPLEDGRYEAYVEVNGNRSESVFFVINSTTDYHPIVTIFFNPDIDPGGE